MVHSHYWGKLSFEVRASVDKPFKGIMEFVPNCLVKGLHLEFPFFKNQSCCDRGATWGRS